MILLFLSEKVYPERRTKLLTFKRKSSTTVIVFIIFLNLQSNFSKMNDSEKFVVCVRGLPWSTTVEGVAEFFSGKSYKIFLKSNMSLVRYGYHQRENTVPLCSPKLSPVGRG